MARQNVWKASVAALLVLALLIFGYQLGRGRGGDTREVVREVVEERLASLDAIEGRLLRLEGEIASLRGAESPDATGGTGDTAPDPDARLAAIESGISALQERIRGLEAEPVSRGFSYLESENAELRREGVNLLARVARIDPEARAAIRGLLGDPSPRVREQAAQKLRDLRDRESEPLMRGLLEDPDPGTRRRAVQALGAMESRDATRQIGGALVSDADDAVREAAAEVLRRLKPPEAEEFLTKALKDRNDGVRAQAIMALGEMGATSAASDLRAMYEQDPGRHRVRLVLALKSLGDDVTLQREVGRLSDLVNSHADDRVRQQSVRELAILARDASQEIFSQALEDPSARVRLEAEKALR